MTKKKLFYRERMVLGQWYLQIVDRMYTIHEIWGPFNWAELRAASVEAVAKGYRKEQ